MSSISLVHFVWKDGTYDMVAFQAKMKYGRASGVEFGPIDTVKYAESFGAVGMRVKTSGELESVLKKALETPGPWLDTETSVWAPSMTWMAK
jgi:acetolactate synthase-1/2/3 large subunit